MLTKLARLCDTAAPSGYEDAAARLAADMLEPLVNEVKRDAFGNVFGYLRCGKPGAPLLALDAHLDEIGVMITGYKDGFAHIRMIGNFDARIMPGCCIRLLADPVIYGTVACLPPHVAEKSDFDKATPFDELLLDLGLEGGDAEKLAPVGTVGVYDSAFADLGGSFMGKALDDRAGFVMILRALELLRDKELSTDVVVCGVVQEEVGLRGAMTSAFGQAPDLCVAVDVTHAYTPDAPKDRTFRAGDGPCIGVGPSLSRKISGTLTALAKSGGIPYQLEVMGRETGTDAWAYQTAREGIPSGLISLPLKYMHTPSELLRKDDFENSARLLAAFIEEAGK